MCYFRKIVVIILLFIICYPALSQDNKLPPTQLKIVPEIYNFGKIMEKDGIVDAKFTITNISKKPYIINYSYSGCGCVAAKVSKEPLMPGKSRDIYVEFDPKRRPGVFQRDVMLVSNNKKRGDMLNIKGEVIPRVKSVSELYPISTIDGVSLSDEIIPLGIISQNEKSIGVINYYNNSKSTVNIELKVKGSKEGVATLSSKTLAPNRSGQIQFTYDLVGVPYYGELSNTVELYVNGKKWTRDIAVNALAVFNFFEMTDAERASAPRAIIAPTAYTVSAFDKNIVIPILNNGKSNLKLLTTIPSKFIGFSLKDKIIKPNQESELIIHLKNNSENVTEGSLTLMFNAPDTPIVTINLKLKK